jgi:dephospho-CoA kinase
MATKRLAITGGIGMGKSTVASALDRMNIPVIDTDQIARDIVAPGESALTEIRAFFGPAALRADGMLDRAALAQKVFREPEARQRLEAITHPRIRERWMTWVGLGEQQGWRLAAVVIPLLHETEARGWFDRVICVACTATTQQQRLSARGWSQDQIDARRHAQWSVERKMQGSDYVIWTEGQEDLPEIQLRHILARVLS